MYAHNIYKYHVASKLAAERVAKGSSSGKSRKRPQASQNTQNIGAGSPLLF
jgi:hypothetical protein